MMSVKVKPLSVNEAWQGKRFKTKKYNAYIEELMFVLPPKLDIPEGDLEVEYSFWFSSKLADYDNPIKPFQDILQKKYGFDDNRIVKAIVTKKLVDKGLERIFFDVRAAH